MIIGKSVKYDLASEAAYKFERGTDICIQDFALRRFIKIVKIMQKLNLLQSIQQFKNLL